MTIQTYTGSLVVQDCIECGMTFGVAKAFDSARRKDHRTFVCPAGHPQYYPAKSDEEKLREELQREQRWSTTVMAQRDQEAARADHERSRANGYKGQLVKTKKRIGNGVCPCCNRHFKDVERHMKSKHPELSE